MNIAVVLKGYPRLSETFIANEIHGLEQRGIDVTIISLRHPTDIGRHPVHKKIKADVLYLPEYLHHEPFRVCKGWWAARKQPGYQLAFRKFFRDLRRDISRNRIRRFGQACVLAAELSPATKRLYAHFLHTPASVTRYAATMQGLPWSVSAHAVDIWTSPEWELSEKLSDCEWAVTCTATNHEYLGRLSKAYDHVELLYHGLSIDDFPAPKEVSLSVDGQDDREPVVLLSVGRAVAKKGYDDLLVALSMLPPELNWRFVHVGGGELAKKLKDIAEGLGISERVEWRGALSQKDVLAAYRTADIFVLASKITSDGDRDGLPNVLMEAQSQLLPVISTRVSAIPEIIQDGKNGLLVSSESPEELSTALVKLIRSPTERLRMGKAGRQVIESRFSNVSLLDRLVEKFRESSE